MQQADLYISSGGQSDPGPGRVGLTDLVTTDKLWSPGPLHSFISLVCKEFLGMDHSHCGFRGSQNKVPAIVCSKAHNIKKPLHTFASACVKCEYFLPGDVIGIK